MSKKDLTDLTPREDTVSLPDIPVLFPLAMRPLRIASQEITDLKFVARGYYGVVYRGQCQGETVAVKQFSASTAGENAQEFLQEAQIMAEVGLASPYLMSLKKICLEPPHHYWLVMDYMPEGSLHALLKNSRDLPWPSRYRIALHICYGLRDLHVRGILHRDLKSLNVLLTGALKAKLTDFGLAKLKDKTLTQSGSALPKGTVQWIAPELLQPKRAKWTLEADIYSLGMVLWELAARKMPYLDSNPFTLPQAIGQGLQETIPTDCPPDFKALIELCWRPPAQRPTAAKVAQQLELLLTGGEEKTEGQPERALPLPLADYWSLPEEDILFKIRTQTADALQQGSPFPNFRSLLWEVKETKETKEKESYPDWTLWWAVAEACETVLCSPHSTYAQQRQAMGDWVGQAHDQQVNLASLIEYGLHLPRYQPPHCVEIVAQVFHRLLNPATPLPLWVRHLVYYGWERLNQPVADPKTKEPRSRLTSDYALNLKKNIERWRATEEKTPSQSRPAKGDDCVTSDVAEFFHHYLREEKEKEASEEKRLTQEKPKSVLSPPSMSRRELTQRFKKRTDGSLSWFAQVAEWLNGRLPAPPCAFKPFVMIKATGKYQLGIELADGFYRHHPFFSHWAECLRLCVGLFSEYTCELDVSAVSHFSRERPNGVLPDAIGTHRELVRQPTPPSTHWRYHTTPMIRLDGEGGRPLDLHGFLTHLDQKTHLRPHAQAINRQWQYHLNALTTDTPEDTVPVAQLQWPESKSARYLSAALTRRLFYTKDEKAGQLASATRSATPGQRDVWRLTAQEACQYLPELPGETILAYLKADPQNPWRQWQHLTLAQRLVGYGHTGTIATLRYGRIVKGQFQPENKDQKPIIVWLSSPAGLTFCTKVESKDSKSAPDIQILDTAGEDRLKRCLAQLDPRSFTQAVFLTWLLVHEDDQLRNLGFEPFINAQGEGAFRVIAFDTDTCLEAPWIRKSDGGIQIKLKSLLLCFNEMQRPLNESAQLSFLALEPETILEAWLEQLSVVRATDHRLPSGSLDQLYQRWLRLRQVLDLPLNAEDPMTPTRPHTHLELLSLLDPVLGEAYQYAFEAHPTDPLVRFEKLSQDYLFSGDMKISVSSGLLRGQSMQQPRSPLVAPSSGMKIKEALLRCKSYGKYPEQLTRLMSYLNQQAQRTSGNLLFEMQMNHIVDEVQKLNRQTQTEINKRLQQKNRLDRATTRVSQWEPMIADNLSVSIILPETPASQSLAAWQSACVQEAKAGIRLEKIYKEGSWQIYAHNGNYLIINGSVPEETSLEQKETENWRPLVACLAIPTPEPKDIRQACLKIYNLQLAQLKKINRELLVSEGRLRRFAEQRQEQLLRRHQSGKTKFWYEIAETDTHFLSGLLETTFRRLVINHKDLEWARLPSGRGLQQLLRLLELGGLIDLNLQNCSSVENDHLLALLQNAPDLTHLNVSGCVRLTSRAIIQCAISAPNLLRLSARQLPRLTDLWVGSVWLTAKALIFPRLTHADFRGCANLTRIVLQAPMLQYLHLGGCATSISRLNSTQNWTFTTPLLQQISLQDCTSLARLKIDSESIDHIDARGALLNLSLLKMMLTPQQWASVTRLQLSDSKSLGKWSRLIDYPFLIPLAEEWVSADKLLALHSIFSHQNIAPLLKKLPVEGRQRLQVGFVLFLWQSSKEELFSFNSYLKYLKDPSWTIRARAARILDQTYLFYSAVAHEVFQTYMIMLKDPVIYKMPEDYSSESPYEALPAVAKMLGYIVSSTPSLITEVLQTCMSLLKNSNKDIRRSAREVLGKMMSSVPDLIPEILKYSIQLLKYSDENTVETATEMIAQIVLSVPDMTPRLSQTCMSFLKALGDSEILALIFYSPSALEVVVSLIPELAATILSICVTYIGYFYKKNITNFIIVLPKIISVSPILTTEIFKYYASLIAYFDVDIRRTACEALKKTVSLTPTLATEILSLCVQLLKDFDHFFKNGYKIESKIIGSRPDLSSSFSDDYLTSLNGSHSKLRQVVCETLEHIVSSASALAAEVFPHCIQLLKDSNSDVRQTACKALGKIVLSMPALAEKAFQHCVQLSKDSENDVRQTASSVLCQIASLVTEPSLLDKILDTYIKLLKDSSEYIRQNTIETLSRIGISISGLATKAFYTCKTLMNDHNADVRCAVIKALGLIGSSMPNLASEAFQACSPKTLCFSPDTTTETAVETLGLIGSSTPALATQAFEICRVFLISKYYSYPMENYDIPLSLRRVAFKAIERISLSSPTLAIKIQQAFIKLLQDSPPFDTVKVLLEANSPVLISMSTLIFRAWWQASSIYQIKKNHLASDPFKALQRIASPLPPDLTARAIQGCIPLLKNINDDPDFDFDDDDLDDDSPPKIAIRAIEKMVSFNPMLIYSLLKMLPDLLEEKSDRVKPNITIYSTTLFITISIKYQIKFGQTLGGYIETFLQKWFKDHSIQTKPITGTAAPEFDLPPAAGTVASSTPAIPVLSLTTLGDDRCLAKNAGERHYWYSVADLCLLTAVIRAQLNYYLPEESKAEYKMPGGERFSAYRENQQGIFIADPYIHVGDCQFGQFLKEDIAVITGTHSTLIRRHRWNAMPRQLFFSLLYHSHWQLIGIEIDYVRANYWILWDDPFGKERFTEPFYKELLPDIRSAVDALFKTHRLLTQDTQGDESKWEPKPDLTIKLLDQQGWGVNGYDCGPIVMQNLEDYVVYLKGKTKTLTTFDEKQHYTIPAADVPGWDEKLIKVRADHFKHAKQVAADTTLGIPKPVHLTTQQTALTKAQQAQQAQLTDEKTAVPRELAVQISALPAAPLGVLFATINHQRLLDNQPLQTPYTAEELQTGYARITKSQKEKPAEMPKTLSSLFPPSPKSSSPPPATPSSLSSSTATSVTPGAS